MTSATPHAREITRSLITQITVTPYDEDGRRPDWRGVGAVRVYVDGEVSRLVDHAMHDFTAATFQFYN